MTVSPVSTPAPKTAPARWRHAWLAIAPAFALLSYWRVPITWFANDDFAWLGLRLEVHHARDLLDVLFAPRAQGTVRFLGERLFFLVFSVVFGFHALPYHVFALATWCADLVLAALIGAELTKSKAAGVLGAVFWTASSILVTPIAWASAYNELLCAFCILLAFYARLRNRRALEWIAYLAGFGALEVIVVYPAIAALYALCGPSRSTAPQTELRPSGRGASPRTLVADRSKSVLATLPLFIPAILFTILHFALIPKGGGIYYKLQFDTRIFSTLLQYLKWCLGPDRLYQFTSQWGRFGTRVMWITALTLSIFVIARIYRREWIALFFCGWFLFLIAPVLPLPFHVVDYYASIAELGLAWLAGWAMVVAWKKGTDHSVPNPQIPTQPPPHAVDRAVRPLFLPRAFAVALAACSLAGSIREDDAYTRWYYRRSIRMESLFFGVQNALHVHPGNAMILQGVDNDLFQTGFQDDPFRLLGFPKIYLAPGGEAGIVARQDLGGVAPFLISPREALSKLSTNQARVLAVSSDGVHDITRGYQLVLHADPRATRIDAVDAGDPAAAESFGPSWFPPEGGFRWMPKSATVLLSAPTTPTQRLYITGFSPAAVLQSGPVTMTLRADQRELGRAVLKNPNTQFAFDFALPNDLVDKQSIEISVELDKVLHAPSDNRELGMVFGTFSIH
jgi:hypothetical protein